MKTLICGLGNIGAEYDHTRHNIGFDIADAFAREAGVTFSLKKHAMVAEGRIKNKSFILIKPTTYMNLSGKAVRLYMQEEKISPENLLVVTDDLSLDTGVIRIRLQGSHGGHNGLRNIEETLLTRIYPRLRFGIGNSFDKTRQIEFVLGKWKPDEQALVNEKTIRAAEALKCFLLEGPNAAMNQYNG